jgi:hypothetical protein
MPYIVNGNVDGNRRNNAQAIYGVEYEYDYPQELDLRPGSPMHEMIVDEVLQRAHESHTKLSQRFDSWNKIDQTLTAYKRIDEDEEEVLDSDDRKPVSIVFPYTYAVHETMLTYIMTALVQDPIFQYEGQSPNDTIGAKLLEKKVALDCYKNKVSLALHTLFSDSLRYGIGLATPGWHERYGTRYVRQSEGVMSQLGRLVGREPVFTSEENQLLFEGNKLENIDPYMALPDPGVSIHKIQDGDFFGWIDETTRMQVLGLEAQDEDYFNVKYLSHLEGLRSGITNSTDRDRQTISGDMDTTVKERTDVIYMYVTLVPSEWASDGSALGEGDYPEKWLFAVAADSVVIMAKPLGLSHGMYPVAAAAPDFDGYSTAPLSRLETLYGLQSTIDWLFNSHIANVRKAINDMLIVDPYLLNMKDLKDPKPGKLIRTRRPAWGKGVKDAVAQLNVNDITRQNIGDTSFIVNWMNHVSGTDEAMMGSLRQSGPERLTSAEFQGTRSSALSRLNRVAMVTSVMAMQDIAYFFAAHTQQLMSQDTYVSAAGDMEEVLRKEYGKSDRIKVTPFDLLIDYDIVGRDGSVPGNQNVEAWLQLMQILTKEPEVRREFDVPRIFKHVARELGAKNVHDFVRRGGSIQPQVMDDETAMREVEKGNLRAV